MTWLAAALVLAPPVFNYQVGETVEYTLTREYVNPAYDEVTVYIDRLVYEMLEPDEEGRWTVRDGESIPVRQAEDPLDLVELREPSGRVLRREAEPVEPVLSERLKRAADLIYPQEELAPGLVWTVREPATSSPGLPAAEWRFECQSLEDGGAFIRTEFQETSGREDAKMNADGWFRVNLTDGWPESFRLTVRNARMPGDELREPVFMNLQADRIRPDEEDD
jgi:hypothetical protein